MNLDTLPERMRRLPRDRKGRPVPWFVQAVGPDGQPDFRIVHRERIAEAVRTKVCWCCGEPLGTYKTFVGGPMCAVNRTVGDPPSHRDCAEWSACNCPFLSRPNATRRPVDGGIQPAGFHSDANPTVCFTWTTKRFDVFRIPPGMGEEGELIQIGPAESVEWWRDGRAATRQEVEQAFAVGVARLHAMAEQEGESAVAQLAKMVVTAQATFPEELAS